MLALTFEGNEVGVIKLKKRSQNMTAGILSSHSVPFLLFCNDISLDKFWVIT